MRLLITGAHGFLGGSIAGLAHGLGHEVVGVARSPQGGAPFRIVRAEGERALTELCDTFAPEAIVHAAGTASVSASLAAPRDDFAGSVLTWVDLLEAVRRSNRRPVILLPSSAAVYGDPARLPVPEGTPPRPISPYGFHKLAAELIAEEYACCFGLDVVVARLFSVFGPAQRRLLVWELFEQLTGSADQVSIQGTGRETRDFLHVDDVGLAALHILSARLGAAPEGRAEILNVASGDEISVLELAQMVRAMVGSSKAIACRGVERPGDPRRWCADVTRLNALLSPWKPRSARAMLPECIAAWQRRGGRESA
jgi:UDP-glucose 4-epimerase